MEVTTLKQYIGTKKVKAEPMVKSAAVAKGWARRSGSIDAIPVSWHEPLPQCLEISH